jgi:hypothetical protein
MTEPVSPADAAASRSSLLTTAIWVVIGALIAAALVCVVWVLFGSQNGLVGRAFLTILLLIGFAAVAIMDVRLAARRPVWFALTSMAVWIVTLLIGAFMIWMPGSDLSLAGRVLSFLLIVLILQLAVLHVRLYWKAHERRPTTFTTIVTYVTIALVAVLAILLVLPLMVHEWVDFHELYWRFVVAVTILAALGTALVPLVNMLFIPRPPRAPKPLPWPTYADGRTPLPVMPDGQPDWQAYYTGRPTYAQPLPPSPAQAALGYPGQPPAPPQSFAAPQAYPQSQAYPPQGYAPSQAYAPPQGYAPALQVPPVMGASMPPIPPEPAQPAAPPQQPPMPPTTPPTEPPTQPPAPPIPPAS